MKAYLVSTLWLLLLGSLLCTTAVRAADETLSFDDAPLQEPLTYPEWFKLSFLNLPEDLQDVKAAGKSALIVYFGQKYCPYCKALLEKDFGEADIRQYTRAHFEVVAIDIWGDRQVTDMRGRSLSEKAFSQREKTDFTPSLIFYNTDGEAVLRLRGYHPPYQFRAALEYVADGHYRHESFRHYLARADPTVVSQEGELDTAEFFARPPYLLDRTHQPAERPLVVFFEQRNCHACDVLHSEQLQNPQILSRLRRMEVVQLDMWADTPVLTPGGERTTAKKWADELGLFYAPTLIFYDAHGKEIIRLDSLVRFQRLRRVLDYVLSGAYREGITLQTWWRRHGGGKGGESGR